ASGGGSVPNMMGSSKQYAGTYSWGFVGIAASAVFSSSMMRVMQVRWTRTWAEKGGRARHHGGTGGYSSSTLNSSDTPRASCHSAWGLRAISGVAKGACRGREAPRSRASSSSSAVSKRWRGSRATALSTTWSSQMGTSGRSREGGTGSRR
ncbi:hypothetical protein OY671_011440, partial [Metschnikowia pulcherrima]